MRRSTLTICCLVALALCTLPNTSTCQYYFGKNKIQYTDFDWQIIYTSHFHLYFYAEERELAEIVAAMAEQHYQDLEQKFAHHIFKPIPLILYSAPSYFQQTNTIPILLPEGVGGFFEYMKGRVVIPCHGSLPALSQVLRHELVHVFMHHKIDSAIRHRHKIVSFAPPLWFTEGLAEYWSQDWDSEADMILRDAVLTGHLVHLQDIYKINGSFLMYKQGQSIVRFIAHTFGDEALTHLLENWPKAKNFDRLLKLTIGLNTKELNDAWVYSLKKKYFPMMKDKESAEMIALRLTEEEGIHVKPAVVPSPEGKGDKEDIVFLTNTMGYSDISLLTCDNGTRKRKQIVKGGQSAKFESFHLLQTKISVNGAGQLAFVTKDAERDALCFWDLEQFREVGRHRWDQLIAISSPSWSPGGEQVAFSGLEADGKSDLYVYDIKGDRLQRLTNDIYDDRDPDWSPDGTRLIFSSDRGPFGQEGFYNLYALSLSVYPHGDEVPLATHGSPPAPEPSAVSSGPRPVTSGRQNDYAPAWSPDGRYVAFSSDRDGTFNIYLTDLQSNFWQITTAFGGAFDPDWTTDGQFIIFSGFEEYQFHLYRAEAPPDPGPPHLVAAPADAPGWEPPTLQTQASRGPLAYHKKFTLDIAQSAFAFVPGWGAFGGVQIALSDMLGNHHYYFLLANTAESSAEFLERFNVGGTYFDYTHRFNYGYGAFHLANDYFNDYDGWYFQREYGLFGAVNYPLTKFERIETSMQLKNSDRRGLFRDSRRNSILAANYISYVRDTSLWGPVGPLDGMRCNLTFGITTDLSQRENNNISVLTDIRKYFRLSRRTCYALRLVNYYSGGDEPLRFYMGGSWSLRGYSFRRFFGRQLLLINNEFRFPLIDDLKAGLPFMSFGLQSIRGAFFFDAGNAWENDSEGLFGSFGLGARMRVGGLLVLRLDVAKTTDFHTISPHTAVQFFFGWNY